MTSIIYRKRYNSHANEENAIILREICGVGTDAVEICLENLPSGYICVGNIKALTVGGRATLNMSSLSDGLYTPIYMIGTRAVLCSPFIKRGNVLMRPLPDGSDIARLELLISSLCERISALEELATDFSEHIISQANENTNTKTSSEYTKETI